MENVNKIGVKFIIIYIKGNLSNFRIHFRCIHNNNTIRGRFKIS